MTTTTVPTTTTCPDWCATDHAAERLRLPDEENTWHRRVLARLEDDRIGISGSIEIAMNQMDLAETDDGSLRVWVWLAGNSALVGDLGIEELASLGAMFSHAASEMAICAPGSEGLR